MNQEIKDLMIQAIEEQRPNEILPYLLPIWNQPFFYKIDKAKALTISYNPTDKGARLNYPNLLKRYNSGENLTSEEIFNTLYTFEKENYWRKNYDLIFGTLGIDTNNEISHMDVSFFPYKTLQNCLEYSYIDSTKKYLLKTIDLLGEQLKYIFVDGAKNKGILNFLISDFNLYKKLKARKNKSPKKFDLLIYKHKSRNLFLIYYGCFLYGSTCPSKECVKNIARLIKESVESN